MKNYFLTFPSHHYINSLLLFSKIWKLLAFVLLGFSPSLLFSNHSCQIVLICQSSLFFPQVNHDLSISSASDQISAMLFLDIYVVSDETTSSSLAYFLPFVSIISVHFLISCWLIHFCLLY